MDIGYKWTKLQVQLINFAHCAVHLTKGHWLSGTCSCNLVTYTMYFNHQIINMITFVSIAVKFVN